MRARGKRGSRRHRLAWADIRMLGWYDKEGVIILGVCAKAVARYSPRHRT